MTFEHVSGDYLVQDSVSKGSELLDEDDTRSQYIFGLIPNKSFELTDAMRKFGLAEDTLYAASPRERQRLAKIARGGDRIVALGGIQFTTLERHTRV